MDKLGREAILTESFNYSPPQTNGYLVLGD
jgi:hypothetical protein